MKFIKIPFNFVRCFLGIFFIVYGILNLSRTNKTKTESFNNLTKISEYLFNKYKIDLKNLIIVIKKNIITIIRLMDLSYIYSGLLMFFGCSMSKVFSFLSLFIEMILTSSLEFKQNDMNYMSFIAFVSLLGIVQLLY